MSEARSLRGRWRRWQKDHGRPETIFLCLFGGACLVTVLNTLCLIVFGSTFFADRLVPGLPLNEDGTPRNLTFEEFRNLALGLVALGGSLFGLFQLANIASRTRLTRLDTDIKREAERNERFVKAATLLGDDNASISLAGVAALKRLAEEDSGAYRETVVDLLSGFVREQTNREDYPPRVVANMFPEPENAEDLYKNWPAPSAPVSSAVTVLSELSWSNIVDGYDTITVDLRGAVLPGLRAPNLRAAHWDLSNAILAHANLNAADFSGAEFLSTVADHTSFEHANFRRSRLDDSSLRRCRFANAVLEHAEIVGCDFFYADMSGASLAYSEYRGGNLSDARFSRTNLQEADFSTTGTLDYLTIFAETYIHSKQLWESVWPSNRPPRFCTGTSLSDFDKSWCSTPDGNALLPRQKWGKPGPFPAVWPPEKPATEDTSQP